MMKNSSKKKKYNELDWMSTAKDHTHDITPRFLFFRIFHSNFFSYFFSVAKKKKKNKGKSKETYPKFSTYLTLIWHTWLFFCSFGLSYFLTSFRYSLWLNESTKGTELKWRHASSTEEKREKKWEKIEMNRNEMLNNIFIFRFVFFLTFFSSADCCVCIMPMNEMSGWSIEIYNFFFLLSLVSFFASYFCFLFCFIEIYVWQHV